MTTPLPIQSIAVVGAGLTGLAAALACSRSHDVTLLDAGSLERSGDRRASFLSPGSARMLERLGVKVEGQGVSRMEVGEGRPGEPLRGEPLIFGDDGVPLGVLVENDALRAALVAAVRASGIDVREGVRVEGWEADISGARLETSAGPVESALVVAADGSRSRLRTEAGIGVERHDYGRSALSFTVAHTLPHEGAAYQIFFPNGPLAVLPLASDGSGHRSSVVWTDTPRAVAGALAVGPDALAKELARRIGDGLGELRIEGEVGSYPLHQVLAESSVAERLALVGDAAHVIHPLAGQGLNLGLRDAAALAEVVREAKGLGRDIGGPALGEYARWRRGDVRGMALATDALGHVYAWGGALGALRRAGTIVVGASGLGALVAGEAGGERGNMPELMR